MSIFRWIAEPNIGAMLSWVALGSILSSPVLADPAAFYQDIAAPAESRPAWVAEQPMDEENDGAVGAEPLLDARQETVYERYQNRSVRVERQVNLDSNGNYVNQGSYRHFSPKGVVLRQGQFSMGLMEGTWQWVFNLGEGSLFSGQYDRQFRGPFLSQAQFQEGKLNGVWMITDRFGQKIIEWHFANGVRSGQSTWWYPNGQARRQVDYRNGVEEGVWTEWLSNGR